MRNLKRKSIIALFLGLILLIMGLALGCSTQKSNTAPAETSSKTQEEVKTNFPEKNITFVVPVSPGGGFDTIARIFAPYLEKYLPNDTTVVIKNVPGGEWNIGINEVYKANPDGYTIGIFNLPGNVVNQILGTANFKLEEFTYLGRLSSVTYVTALSPRSEYRTLEELQNAASVKAGAVSLASTAGLGTFIAGEVMGINMNIIPHDGSSEAILAALRGDVDWVQYPYESMRQYVYESDELIPIMVFADKRLEELPDVPTVGELGFPELADIITMHRIVGATPGIPSEVAEILRDAFWQAANDPEFKKQLEEQGNMPDPVDATRALEIITNSLVEYEKYKKPLEEARK